MTREEIIEFLNANQFCYLATVENGEPRVRGMSHYKVDENGIIFHTGEIKDIPAQLRSCPKAEICIFNPESGKQVRVRGTVEFVDDRALKGEIMEARPFIKPFVEAMGYDAFVVFRLKDCQATVWTMEANMQPKTFVKL